MLLESVTPYTLAVDSWAAGAILGEMFLGQPLFESPSDSDPEDKGIDQFFEIYKILGSPSKEEKKILNPKDKMALSLIPPMQKQKISGLFTSVSHNKGFPVAVFDLMEAILIFDPSIRMDPINALMHPYFD